MSAHEQDWTRYPLFDGLSKKHLSLLARGARDETFDAREMIFREGDSADWFYVISKGHVAVEIFANERGPMTIQTVGPGEVLGWSWLVEPYRWHFDAQATTTTEAVAFDARSVRESFDAHPDLGYALMKRFVPIIVSRMQATRLQLLDVYHAHA